MLLCVISLVELLIPAGCLEINKLTIGDPMKELSQLAIDAHGGLDRFRQFSYLSARLEQGGVLWALKGKPTVWRMPTSA